MKGAHLKHRIRNKYHFHRHRRHHHKQQQQQQQQQRRRRTRDSWIFKWQSMTSPAQQNVITHQEKIGNNKGRASRRWDIRQKLDAPPWIQAWRAPWSHLHCLQTETSVLMKRHESNEHDPQQQHTHWSQIVHRIHCILCANCGQCLISPPQVPEDPEASDISRPLQPENWPVRFVCFERSRKHVAIWLISCYRSIGPTIKAAGLSHGHHLHCQIQLKRATWSWSTLGPWVLSCGFWGYSLRGFSPHTWTSLICLCTFETLRRDHCVDLTIGKCRIFQPLCCFKFQPEHCFGMRSKSFETNLQSDDHNGVNQLEHVTISEVNTKFETSKSRAVGTSTGHARHLNITEKNGIPGWSDGSQVEPCVANCVANSATFSHLKRTTQFSIARCSAVQPALLNLLTLSHLFFKHIGLHMWALNG